MDYATLESLSDEELTRVRALADYTLLTRTTLQQMTLEQLVHATDAARVLLLSETDDGVRNALLDGINAINQEARRRNEVNPQRVVGQLRPGSPAQAVLATGRS